MTTRRVDSATFYTDLSKGSFQTRQNKNITDGLAFQGSSQFVRALEEEQPDSCGCLRESALYCDQETRVAQAMAQGMAAVLRRRMLLAKVPGKPGQEIRSPACWLLVFPFRSRRLHNGELSAYTDPGQIYLCSRGNSEDREPDGKVTEGRVFLVPQGLWYQGGKF